MHMCGGADALVIDCRCRLGALAFVAREASCSPQ
jgi:hypothetical protein